MAEDTASIRIGLDASEVQEGAESMRRTFQRISEDVRRMAETLAATGRRSESVFDRMRSDANNAGSIFRRLSDSIVAGFGIAIGGAVAGAMNLMASSWIKTASTFEQLKVKLETLTGSSLAAQKAFSWIIEFTKTTPFQLDEVTEAFIRLGNYGQDSTKWLPILADVTGALGKNIMQGVEAVADAMTGEFERLKEFGVKASQQGDKVTLTWTENGQSISKTVQKTSEDIGKGLEAAFQRFKGGMEKQSDTFQTIISNIQDSWTMIQKALMDAGLFDRIKAGAKSLLDYLTKLSNTGELDVWAKSLGDAVSALIDLFITLGKVAGEIQLTEVLRSTVSLINQATETINELIVILNNLGLSTAKNIGGIAIRVQGVWDELSNTAEAIGLTVVGVFQKVNLTVEEAVSVSVSVAQNLFIAFYDAVYSVWINLSQAVSSAFVAVSGIVENILTSINNSLISGFSTVISGIGKALGAIDVDVFGVSTQELSKSMLSFADALEKSKAKGYDYNAELKEINAETERLIEEKNAAVFSMLEEVGSVSDVISSYENQKDEIDRLVDSKITAMETSGQIAVRIESEIDAWDRLTDSVYEAADATSSIVTETQKAVDKIKEQADMSIEANACIANYADALSSASKNQLEFIKTNDAVVESLKGLQDKVSNSVAENIQIFIESAKRDRQKAVEAVAKEFEKTDPLLKKKAEEQALKDKLKESEAGKKASVFFEYKKDSKGFDKWLDDTVKESQKKTDKLKDGAKRAFDELKRFDQELKKILAGGERSRAYIELDIEMERYKESIEDKSRLDKMYAAKKAELDKKYAQESLQKQIELFEASGRFNQNWLEKSREFLELKKDEEIKALIDVTGQTELTSEQKIAIEQKYYNAALELEKKLQEEKLNRINAELSLMNAAGIKNQEWLKRSLEVLEERKKIEALELAETLKQKELTESQKYLIEEKYIKQSQDLYKEYFENRIKIYSDIKDAEKPEEYFEIRAQLIEHELSVYAKTTDDMIALDKLRKDKYLALEQEKALASGNFVSGMQAAYSQLEEQQVNMAVQGQQAFNQMYSGLESGFAGVLSGQIKSFGDFCDNVLSMFKRMLVQMISEAAAKDVMSYIFEGKASKGGLLNLFDKLTNKGGLIDKFTGEQGFFERLFGSGNTAETLAVDSGGALTSIASTVSTTPTKATTVFSPSTVISNEGIDAMAEISELMTSSANVASSGKSAVNALGDGFAVAKEISTNGRSFLTSTWNSIKDYAGKATDFISSGWSSIKGYGEKAVDFVSSLFGTNGGVTGVFSNIWDGIKTGAGKIYELGTSVYSGISKLISGAGAAETAAGAALASKGIQSAQTIQSVQAVQAAQGAGSTIGTTFGKVMPYLGYAAAAYNLYDVWKDPSRIQNKQLAFNKSANVVASIFSPYAALGSLAGDWIGKSLGLNETGQTVISGIGAGAGTGATVGSYFGPWGTVIGGVVGAIVGGITSALGLKGDPTIGLKSTVGKISFSGGKLSYVEAKVNNDYKEIYESVNNNMSAVVGNFNDKLEALGETLSSGAMAQIMSRIGKIDFDEFFVKNWNYDLKIKDIGKPVEAMVKGFSVFLTEQLNDALGDALKTVIADEGFNKLLKQSTIDTITNSKNEFFQWKNLKEALKESGLNEEGINMIKSRYDAEEGGFDSWDDIQRATRHYGVSKSITDSLLEKYQASLDEAGAKKFQEFEKLKQAWVDVMNSINDVIDPISQYKKEMDSATEQYKASEIQLKNLGFSEEALAQVREGAAKAIAKLEENYLKQRTELEKTINDSLHPEQVREFDSAMSQTNRQFDEWKEQMRQLGGSEEQLVKIESQRAQGLKQTEESFAKQRQSLKEQAAQMISPMTQAESAIKNINEQFLELQNRMKSLGGTNDELIQLAEQHKIALELEAKQREKQRSAILNDAEIIAAGETIHDLESQMKSVVAEVNIRFDEMAENLRQLGATESEIGKVRILQTVTIQKQLAELELERHKRIKQSLLDTYNAVKQMADSIRSSLTDMKENSDWLLAESKGVSKSEYLMPKLQTMMAATKDYAGVEAVVSLAGQVYDALVSEAQAAASTMSSATSSFDSSVAAFDETTEKQKKLAEAIEALIKAVDSTISSIKYSELNVDLGIQKLAAASSDYSKLKEKAFTGDQEAMQEFMSFASQYLQMSQKIYGSSGAYQQEYAMVIRDLENLKKVTPIIEDVTTPIKGEGASVYGGVSTVSPDLTAANKFLVEISEWAEKTMKSLEGNEVVLKIDWSQVGPDAASAIQLFQEITNKYGWDNPATITLAARFAENFEGDINEMKKTIGFVGLNSQGGWDSPATLTITTGLIDRFKDELDKQLEIYGFVGTESGWGSKATLTIANKLIDSFGDDINAQLEVFGFTGKEGGWTSPAAIEVALGMMNLGTSWDAIQEFMMENGVEAPVIKQLQMYFDAEAAIELFNETAEQYGWNSDKVITLTSRFSENFMKGLPERLEVFGFVLKESGWSSRATIDILTGMSELGTSWEAVQKYLKEIGVTDAIVKQLKLSFDIDWDKLNKDFDAAFEAYKGKTISFAGGTLAFDEAGEKSVFTSASGATQTISKGQSTAELMASSPEIASQWASSYDYNSMWSKLDTNKLKEDYKSGFNWLYYDKNGTPQSTPEGTFTGISPDELIYNYKGKDYSLKITDDPFDLYKRFPAIRESWNAKYKLQEGGVAYGDESGYPVELHGMEAVIPLKSGFIPLKIIQAPVQKNPYKEAEELLKQLVAIAKTNNSASNNQTGDTIVNVSLSGEPLKKLIEEVIVLREQKTVKRDVRLFK